MSAISEFRGAYRWLSNFFMRPLWFEGKMYPSAEHLFQALKTTALGWRELIRTAKTCREAKRLGRSAPLRPDWEQVKDAVMLEVLRLKFADPELAHLLIRTGEAELVEGNTWNDRYWGVCAGQGENRLGKLLMQVREEILNKNQ